MRENIHNLIENIRRIRLKRKYTQEYMASCLGVGQNAYSKLELGYSKIHLEQLFVIAAALNVQPQELLTAYVPGSKKTGTMARRNPVYEVKTAS